MGVGSGSGWLICALLLAVPASSDLAGQFAQPAAPLPLERENLPEEGEVLWELCRYLRLSRTQVGNLLPTARHVRRAAEQLDKDEAEARDRMPRLSPEEAGLRLQALAEQRARFRDEVARFAAPQLVRLLTREQIALAWRLTGGRPPRYASAAPVLLRPEAGLIEHRGRTLLGSIELQIEDEPSSTLRRGGLDAGRFAGYELTLSAPKPGARPFPQVVVETNDARDLIPAVLPMAGRAFSSVEWLPTLERAWKQGLGIRPSRDHRLVARKAARTVREYRMDRGLRDLTGRGPELEPLGGVLDHGTYQFGPGQGLRLASTGVQDQYEIEVSFGFAGGTEYQKLIDFKSGKSDGGLYTYQGALTFYTLAVGGVPVPGREHRLRLERDRETRIVRGYLDLRPIFAFIDLDDEAVFEAGAGMFFVDDGQTKSEQGPGMVRWVNIRGPVATP